MLQLIVLLKNKLLNRYFEKRLYRFRMPLVSRTPVSNCEGLLTLILRFETTESPLKMMKNAFYFTLNFCLDILVI